MTFNIEIQYIFHILTSAPRSTAGSEARENDVGQTIRPTVAQWWIKRQQVGRTTRGGQPTLLAPARALAFSYEAPKK